jgi:23S rRNA (guanosine2251-2'-O)-methyltransferase
MSSRVVFGVHPVEELLARRAREVKQLLVAKSIERASPIVAAAEARGVTVQRSTAEELDALTGGGNHQGVAAIVGEYAYSDLHELLDRPGGPPPLLLALDCVEDPQNLGAILRSGLVLGATGVIVPADRSAKVTPAVVRVSAGASEHLPCALVTNLARALEELKREGLWIVGAVEGGGVRPEEIDLTGPVAIVLGNEHRGLRPLVLRGCDFRLTIPTSAPIASLNVAAAATAVCYEAARQRRAKAPA